MSVQFVTAFWCLRDPKP
jgi:hypothetical protein